MQQDAIEHLKKMSRQLNQVSKGIQKELLAVYD